MKLSDNEKDLRDAIEQDPEYQRVRNTSKGPCHGVIIVEDIPFLMFRDVTPPHEVYLSQAFLPQITSRLKEIGRFAAILKDMLNS